jgi:hypothetical protein
MKFRGNGKDSEIAHRERDRERREESKLCKNPDASGPKTSRSRSRSQIRTERRGLTSVE